MFGYFNKSLHTYVYINNSTVAGGEPLMGVDIVDIIHKAIRCRTMNSLWKYGHINLVEVTIHRDIRKKLC